MTLFKVGDEGEYAFGTKWLPAKIVSEFNNGLLLVVRHDNGNDQTYTLDQGNGPKGINNKFRKALEKRYRTLYATGAFSPWRKHKLTKFGEVPVVSLVEASYDTETRSFSNTRLITI